MPGIDSQGEDYSYTWHIHETTHNDESIRMFYDLVWGDPLIMVMPDLETVVKFTGANYTTQPTIVIIIERFIVAAIE